MYTCTVLYPSMIIDNVYLFACSNVTNRNLLCFGFVYICYLHIMYAADFAKTTRRFKVNGVSVSITTQIPNDECCLDKEKHHTENIKHRVTYQNPMEADFWILK